TPGIPLAFFAMLAVLYRFRYGTPEWIIAVTIAIGSVALVVAYAMLAIDSRYFYPLIPLWFAIGAKYLFTDSPQSSRGLRVFCVCLIGGGVLFSSVYWASPLRLQRRDWQVVCREAGDHLNGHGVNTVVSVGSGPFPEHGVGWEAG